MSTLTDLIAEQGSANVIVALKPGAALAAGTGATEASLAPSFMPMDAEQAEAIDVEAADAPEAARASAAARPAEGEPRVRVFPRLGVALGYVDEAGLAELNARDDVQSVGLAPQFSLIRPVAMGAAAAVDDVSWGVRRLRLDQLWDDGLTGAGVLIGHLDTGVDDSHPDLAGQVTHFAEFDRLGRIVAGVQPRESAGPETPSAGHGTHTAGTLVGRRNTARGSYGCAPGAKLASALVIEGGQVVTRVIAGLEWAVGHGVRVLSVSLGLPGFHREFEVIVAALRANNVLPIFAVGNEGPNSSRSPGNYPNVLSIGACDIDDRVSDFSSSQSFARAADRLVPDCVGPGGESSAPLGRGILSAAPGGGYVEMSGTSMATPHVAGLAALLFEAFPLATADEVEQAILASCALAPVMPMPRANRGMPDGPGALRALRRHMNSLAA